MSGRATDAVPPSAASPARPGFGSILFPPGHEAPARTGQPGCFIDLNLDQVLAAVVAGHDEAVLRPFFYSPSRDGEVIRYRHAVFRDLERPELFRVFPVLAGAMRHVRADLGYAEKIAYASHRNTVFLRAVLAYCGAVRGFADALGAAVPRAPGLALLGAWVTGYLASPDFRRLAREAEELQALLSGLSYGMLFHGDAVTVRRYAGEPDYTATILERFARFRAADIPPPAARKPGDEYALNHVEEAILEFVGRLFPDEFARLGDFVARHEGFIDATIARFDREIGFYVAWLGFIAPLRQRGLPFCYPEVSATSRETGVTESFDLALAAKLAREGGKVVRNDFHLSGNERLLVVSGPNQGGKTTFARMFGQLHFLAGLGCPVPGKAARLFLPDRVFTHFEREEDVADLRSKLEDDLVRLHATCAAMTADSVVVLNEVFGSTSLDDQMFLSTRILARVLAAGASGICVTFIDTLSTMGEATVSMMSTVDPDDPARRTFRVVRKPADGLAYALSLARKHGVTYEQLRGRIRP